MSRLLLSTAASFLIALRCTPDTESATLEVYSWWDSSGEKAAFNALVGPFERSRPDIDVRNGYRRDSQEVRGDLGALMLQGVPPNTFQANAGADLLQWAAVDFAPAADGPFDGSLPSPQDSWNLLTDVSGLLGREALDALYPEVRRQVCVEASNAEHHLAVPVNIHRLNLLYYNTDRVADAERRFAMDSLCPENAAELAPSERPAFDLAISVGDGLSLTLLTFENLLLAVGKETAYRALLEGGDPSLWRAPMQRALGCLWYLSGAFIEADDWDLAVQAVVSADADLVVMGDWASAEIPEADRAAIGRRPFPGTEEYFVYASDTFPRPKNITHSEHTEALLRSFGQFETQLRFSRFKGSIPALRRAEPPDGLDAWARESWSAFQDPARTKVLATSGWFPRAFPQRRLADGLEQVAEAETLEDFQLLAQQVLDLLEGSLPIFRAWQDRFQPCNEAAR